MSRAPEFIMVHILYLGTDCVCFIFENVHLLVGLEECVFRMGKVLLVS